MKNYLSAICDTIYVTLCVTCWVFARFADGRRATASQKQTGNCYSGGRRIRRIEDACFPVYNTKPILTAAQYDLTRFESASSNSALYRAGRIDIEGSIRSCWSNEIKSVRKKNIEQVNPFSHYLRTWWTIIANIMSIISFGNMRARAHTHTCMYVCIIHIYTYMVHWF